MRRFEVWVQALVVFTLIAGIALLVLQLQQNEKLLRLQIATAAPLFPPFT